MQATLEICPHCRQVSDVRTKLILIDEAWVPAPNKDERSKYHSYLRVDDVQTQHLREYPLEQFMDGFYCNSCQKGFVSENGLKETRRQYGCR